MGDARIIGRLVTGIGQGKHLTRLDWARRQFIAKLGIDPFPGTVNLVIDVPDDQVVWQRVKQTDGVRINNPNDGPRDCDARCYRAVVGGRIDSAIVVPEVIGYPPNQLEIIAAVNLRDALNIADGDRLTVDIKQTASA